MPLPEYYVRAESDALVAAAVEPYVRRADLAARLNTKAGAVDMLNAQRAISSAQQSIATIQTELVQKAEQSEVYSKSEADVRAQMAVAHLRPADAQDRIAETLMKASDFATLLALKADRTDVYSTLDADAKITAALLPYRTAAAQDLLHSTMARSANVQAALALKADKADVFSKAEANRQIAHMLSPYRTSAAQDLVSGEFALKADVAASLALKADKSDVYSKADFETLLAPKADRTELNALSGSISDVMVHKMGISTFKTHTENVSARFSAIERAFLGPAQAAGQAGFEQVLEAGVIRSLGAVGPALAVSPSC